MSITGTDHNVFQYMVNHGMSWISEESIMASSNHLESSYLVSYKNVREIIKIEEMFPITCDEQCSGTADDSNYDCNTYGREYRTYPAEICNMRFPSKTQTMLHEILDETEKPYKCNTCDEKFAMKRYLKEHQTLYCRENYVNSNNIENYFSQRSTQKQHEVTHTGK